MSSDIFTYSNNTNGFMSIDVNERNGNFNFSLHIIDIKANNLTGPELSLSLAFDQNTKDDAGFGPALIPSLPYIDVVNHLFVNDKRVVIKLDSTNNRPAEPCLLDFQLNRIGNNDFKVIYKDGTTDFFTRKSAQSNKALLIRRENNNAGSIKLEWGVADKLKKIHDDTGNEFLSINLAGDKNNREIVLYGGRYFVYTSHNLDVHTVTLPYDSSGQWRKVEKYTIYSALDNIAKSHYVINKVEIPDGSLHELTYTRLKLPSAAQYPSLPAVKTHKLTKNAIELAFTEYKYGATEGDDSDNNAYGLNAVLSMDSYSDPLYSLKHQYFYTVEKLERDHLNNERVKVCKYDKFHNLIVSKVSFKGCSEVETLNYQANYMVDVAEQSRTFKLVKSHIKQYIVGTDIFEEKYDYNYDDYGNILNEVDHLKGIKIEYQYYDTRQGGLLGLCPEYKFICFMRSQIVTDIKSRESRIVSSRKYICIDAEKPLMILLDEDVNVHSSVVTKYTYDSLGRQDSISIANSDSCRTDAFSYSNVDGYICIDVISSANDGYNDNLHEQHVYDKLTGQLISVKEQGATINYSYYFDGRLMNEVVAKGTDYSCERRYLYNDKDNCVTIIDHAENEKAIQFNALGKVLKTYLTIPGVVNSFLSEEFYYNTLGQCYRSICFDAIITGGGGQSWEMTTNYEYSGWGEVERIIRPDGQIEFELYDPISQVKKKGVMGLPYEERIVDWNGRTITRNLRATDGYLMSSEVISHNGFTETIASVDDKGVQKDFVYDKIGRIVNITTSYISNGTLFQIKHKTSYSSFDLTGEYREEININGIQLGKRTYDGHGRLRTEIIDNEKTSFCYSAGSVFHNKIIKNDNDIIEAIYNPHLGSYTTLGNIVKHYHPRTGAVVLAERSDLEGAISFEYRFDGLLSRETSVYGDNIHEYTLKGLPLMSQYCDGSSKTFAYDSLQRLIKVMDGINLITYESFDNFSRPLLIRSVGESNFDITYDYSGLPFKETITTMSDNCNFVEKYIYTGDGKVNSKETLLNGRALSEYYNYDPLGRLVTYLARGERAPADVHGNTISKQEIIYDDYGNISKSIMTLIDGSHNVERFIYDETYPNKLVMIENSNPEYGCYDLSQYYDKNNNLLSDESGRLYSYNIYGELKEVRDNNGLLLCSYDYDALGRIIYQRVGNQPIIEYKFNGENLLSLEQAGSSTSFYYLGDKPVGKRFRKSSGVSYQNYITDKSNTPVRVAFDSHSNPYVDYTYTPYGDRKTLN